VTTEWSDWTNGRYWWFQSVYVVPEWRGRGVFRALWDHVENAARKEGDVASLRLYVERDNASARAVYEKLGMEESGYLVYEKWLIDR
jgi:GNAT superfamily N-acetyltransferase